MEEAGRDVKRWRAGIVPMVDVPQAWPLVAEWVEASLAHSVQHEWTPGDVFASCVRGEYLMLLIGDARAPVWGPDALSGVAILCQNSNPEGQPYTGLICCGGRQVESWLEELWRVTVGIAAAAGTTKIIAVGRPGWKKILYPLGARERATIVAYELTPEDVARGWNAREAEGLKHG